MRGFLLMCLHVTEGRGGQSGYCGGDCGEVEDDEKVWLRGILGV